MTTVSLADIPLLWRAQSLNALSSPCIPTGHAALDDALGGGWPLPSLIELLCDDHGIGELRLLLGLLQPQPDGQDPAGRKIVLWLAPPFEVHAVALSQHGLAPEDHWICSVSQPSDLHWAMSHALRSGACLAVIAWARQLKPATIRALKLAALAGRGIGVLFRPTSAAHIASPATVRMALRAHEGALEVSILKMQGRRPRIVRILPCHVDASSDGAR